jgi:hypothetical protein
MEGYNSDTTNSEFEAKPDFDEQEEDAVDPFADFTTEMQKIRQEAPYIKPEPTPEPLHSETEIPSNAEPGNDTDQMNDIPAKTWASAMQLTTFRNSAATVADEHLKKQNVKLSHRTAKSTAPRDSASYMQGRQDSRKIDVRRRRIE